MNVVRLAVSAGSLTLACAGGFVLLDAPAAHAEECTGLIGCTTKDVGDTVRKAAEGDLEGTVEKAGKTVGDTVDRVTKTAGGGSGGSDGGDDSPEPPAAGGSSAGKDDSPDSGSGSGSDEPGKDEKKQKRKQDREKAKERRSDKERGTAGQDTSMWVSLQQWAQPQPRLALAEMMRDHSSTASLPVTTTVVSDRKVPPPEVAPPPVTAQQPQQQHQEPQRQEPRYLTAVPAADERSPGGPQQLPPGPVFAATALAGTAGMAVLSVYQRRRRTR